MAQGMADGITLSKLTTLINRLSKWLLLLAIIWLCWNIARIVWLVLAPPQAPNLPLASIQNKPAPVLNIGAVLALFNENRPEPAAVSQPVPEVNLMGVMPAMPISLSAAMLEVNGTIGSYRLDEPIQNTGYRLTTIAWDTVTITGDGGREIELNMPERLSLNQEFDASNTGNNANNANNTNNRNQSNPSRSSNLPDSVSGNRLDSMMEQEGMDDVDYDEERDRNSTSDTGNNNTNVDSSDDSGNASNSNDPVAQIDRAVAELKQNPASYLSRVGVMATGDGYQVTEAMPSQLRNRLGLEAGDRVMAVNGRTVGSNPGADADLLNQVKQSGEAIIEVKRGDQVITIRQSF